MKQIPLTQGQFAIVDDADYDWLNQWKWYALKDRRTFYAVRNVRLPDRKRTVLKMHRQILGLERGDKSECDHKNNNGLDNRHDNIRVSTHRQNMCNQRPQKNSSSFFKGVSWHKATQKWQSRIRISRKKVIHLGVYANEMIAALIYDLYALKYFGEFAYTNFGRERVTIGE